MVLANARMIEDYRRYGETVKFDLTFNTLKEKSLTGDKWKLGFFNGLNSTNQPVIFAIAFQLIQDTESYIRLFESFFEIAGSIPETFITDDERAIASALRILKSEKGYRYYHLLDSFHLIRNIRSRVRNKELF